MFKLIWTGIALLLAFSAGLAAFCVVSGLPADATVDLWSPSLHWTPSRVGKLVVSSAIFGVSLAAVFLIYAIVIAAWIGLGHIGDLLANYLRPPQQNANAPISPARKLGIKAFLAFLAAGALISGLLRNVFAIVALVIACLGLATVLFSQRALQELGNGHDRLTIRSRSSAIGGGQTEWQIPPALVFAVLALALAGGTVTLAAVSLRPASAPASKEEVKPTSKETPPPSAEQKTAPSVTSSPEK